MPMRIATRLLLTAAVLACAPTVRAEDAPAKPAAPAPAAAAPAPAPAAAAPAPEEKAPDTAPAPAAAPAAAAPAPAPAPAAENPPPPPTYAPLGGKPEPAAQEGDWDPWEHPAAGSRSHEGFFLRLQLGIGGARVSGDDYALTGGRIRWTSPTFGLGFAIGGSIVDDLALHASLQSTELLSPEQELPGPDGSYDGQISLNSFGIGVTYYFMPINLYLSGSLGLGVTTFESDRGQPYDTSAGATIEALVGKEFWVGNDWGLGAAMQLLLMRTHDRVDGDVTATAFALLFSATYN